MAPVTRDAAEDDLAPSPEAGARGFIAVNRASSNGKSLPAATGVVLTKAQTVTPPVGYLPRKTTLTGEVNSRQGPQAAYILRLRARKGPVTSGKDLYRMSRKDTVNHKRTSTAIYSDRSLSIWQIEHSMFWEVPIKTEETTTSMGTRSTRMVIRGTLRGQSNHRIRRLGPDSAPLTPSWQKPCNGKRVDRMPSTDPGIHLRVRMGRSPQMVPSGNATSVTGRRLAV